jgi:SAM-dependent methyltransferase
LQQKYSRTIKESQLDIRAYNREAWDRQVQEGNPWTIPVSPGVIAAARQGEWSVVLTPTIPVPRAWFPAMPGLELLCLASGGGQQAPTFAAAGAHVTVLDNSPAQLARDQMVARREGLEITTIEGDMRDLSVFEDQRFGLVFHPVSNLFVPDILPVWKEAYRVLKPGGVLLAGFLNPVNYIFDLDLVDDEGRLEVRYRLPYSDLTSLPDDKRQKTLAKGWPLEFSHSLDEQIGGQLAAGFVLTGLYEDHDPTTIMGQTLPTFIATRALKG